MQDVALVIEKSALFGTLSDLGISVDASAFYPSIEDYYGEGDLPFYRVGDVDGLVDVDAALRIPRELCDQYPTLKRVAAGDILFTKGGAIDRVGYVVDAGAVSRDLIFLNTSKLDRSHQVPLFIYFQTEFFRRLLLRSSSQTAQPHLTITLVRDLPIFHPGSSLNARLLAIVNRSYQLYEDASNSERCAETRLLEGLGLRGWVPPTPLSYPTSSAAVRDAGRMDAEFFAPRIRGLIDRLGKDGVTIRDVAPSRREKFENDGVGHFDYIEISELKGHGVAGSTTLEKSEAPSRATLYVHSGDVITSTVRPIRRLSALIEPHQDGDVCSSGFVVLQPTGVSPEVLLTYLRLPVFCELMDLHTSASMYPAISEKDLLSLPFAPPDPATETAVCAAVTNARRARSQAAALLSAAKRAVEIAIETDEAAALRYLDEQEA